MSGEEKGWTIIACVIVICLALVGSTALVMSSQSHSKFYVGKYEKITCQVGYSCPAAESP